MSIASGEVHVWRVELDGAATGPVTAEEEERASRFVREELRKRYLAAHGALRGILRTVVGSEVCIAVAERGKPWLPEAPRWKFNLSHARGVALVAVARDVEVGVDVEWLRGHGDRAAIVERFFPASEAAVFFASDEGDRERTFFRCWTRLEAMWKALGEGLHAAGREMEGPWTVTELDVGAGMAGAVAARAEGMRTVMHIYGESE